MGLEEGSTQMRRRQRNLRNLPITGAQSMQNGSCTIQKNTGRLSIRAPQGHWWGRNTKAKEHHKTAQEAGLQTIMELLHEQQWEQWQDVTPWLEWNLCSTLQTTLPPFIHSHVDIFISGSLGFILLPLQVWTILLFIILSKAEPELQRPYSSTRKKPNEAKRLHHHLVEPCPHETQATHPAMDGLWAQKKDMS